MASLMGTPGELAFTLQITRAATGLTETVELVGRITGDQAEQLGIKTDTQPDTTDEE
jgi:hypothetical protein